MRQKLGMSVTCEPTLFQDQASIYLALEYCDGGDFGDKAHLSTAAFGNHANPRVRSAINPMKQSSAHAKHNPKLPVLAFASSDRFESLDLSAPEGESGSLIE